MKKLFLFLSGLLLCAAGLSAQNPQVRDFRRNAVENPATAVSPVGKNPLAKSSFAQTSLAQTSTSVPLHSGTKSRGDVWPPIAMTAVSTPLMQGLNEDARAGMADYDPPVKPSSLAQTSTPVPLQRRQKSMQSGPQRAEVYDTWDCGAEGNNVTATLALEDDGTISLTFSGTGAMADYSGQPGPWGGYYFDNVVIEEGITHIGNYAFLYVQLNEITLPNSVISIGERAFYGSGLPAGIQLGTGLKTIGFQAFQECAFTSIDLPEGLTDIGIGAFYRCYALESVTFPNSLNSLGNNAFEECMNLSSVDFGSGLTTVSRSAFYNCPWLSEVTLPDNITAIGDYAFYGCSNLSSVDFGNGLKTIGLAAFYECALTSVNLPEGLTDIGIGAFFNCSSLESVTLPNSLDTLKSQTFQNCTQLSSVNFGSGLTTVGVQAFAFCSMLSEVVLPNSVISLGTYAFAYCTGLATLTIGQNLTTIGQDVVYGCQNLVAINVVAGNPAFASQGGVLFSADMKTLIQCPIAKTGSYAIPEGVDSIANSAFAHSGISSVIFPNSVRSIGTYAFFVCNELTSVTLGSGITSLAEGPFAACPKLAAINVAAGNTVFSSVDGVLFNINKTTLLQYPSGKQGNLYTVPNSVKTIGNGAFVLTLITGINFPEGLTTIGGYAFQECQNLTSITLPENLVNLGDGAFYSCYELTSVTLPSGLTELGADMFSDCVKLTSINLPAGLKSIGSYAFAYSGLTGITFPEGLESVGENAFYYCPELTSVTLPASMDSIGSGAFYIPYLKKIICLNPTPFQIGTTAFGNVGGSRIIRIEVPQSSVDQYKAAWSTYAPYITYTGAPLTWACGITDGYLSDAIIATLSNDTLYINGEGEMANLAQPLWYAERENITTVVIGEGVTSIAYYAFLNCSALTSVVFSESVEYIGGYAFSGCTSLTELNLPASLLGFSADAFNNTVLLNFNVAEGSPYFATIDGVLTDFNEEMLWQYPKGRTGAYTIPEGITGINVYAFKQCSNLTAVNFPESLEAILNYAFEQCTGLTELSFPESLNTIGNDAFRGCTGLTSLSFSQATMYILQISDYAFAQCTNLEEVLNFNPAPGAIQLYNQVFDGVNTAACTLKVPQGSEGDYQEAAVWQDFLIEAIVYHTVNFDLNGGEGSIVPLSEVLPNSKITAPSPEPAKADFTFGGWWKTEDYADYTKRWDFDNDVVTADITLYAKWIDNTINTYTVTFDSKGGSAVNPYLGIDENSTIAEPAAPTRTGYNFAGWWKDTDYMTTLWNFETDPVTADLTLFAKWDLKTYTVTFDAQGGSAIDNITNVAHGTTITAPDPNPAKTGYTFLYWSQNNPETTDMPAEWNFAANKVMNNITLYAVWEITMVYVYFDLQNGDQNVDRYPYNSLIEEPKTPTRAGYIFGGWYKEPECTTPWDFTTDRATEEVTIYAKWTIRTYDVAFNTMGGSSVDTVKDVTYGSFITAPTPNPIKASYAFEGWYRESECTNKWSFSDNVVTSNLTLYANWVSVDVPTFTVTFNSMGGSPIAAAEGITSGSRIQNPGSPTRTGYTFIGWYKDENGTTAWNFNTDQVTASLTLYAKWAANTYTVTFNSKGGSPVSSLTEIAHGSTITAPTAPTKADHTFGGWHKDDGCTLAWAFDVDVITSNTMLYAKWTENSTDVAVTGVSLDKTEITLTVGELEQLEAIIAPSNATNTNVTWSSSTPAVAAVTNGLITAVSVGTASIIAKTVDGNFTDTCKVTVNAVASKPKYTVTISESSNGAFTVKNNGVLVSSGDEIDSATVLTLQAVPDAGYKFAKWHDNDTNANRTITLKSDLTISATFEALPDVPVIPKYTVTLVQPSNGTFTVKNGNALVPSGTQVDSATVLTLQATPNAGYKFVKWHDNNTNANRTIELNSNITISATFEALPDAPTIPKYTVTVVQSGGGIISVKNGSFDVASGTQVDSATVLTLQATPNVGYRFVKWHDNNTNANREIELNSDITISATFEILPTIPKYTVTFSQSSNGTFTVKNNGILVSSGDEIDSATILTLQAVPDAGYKFVKWHDNDTNANRTITLKSDLTISATFEAAETSIIGRETEEGLKIYPNPVSNGVCFVEIPDVKAKYFSPSSSGQIQIYDFSGKLVLQQSITGKTTEVNISHLPNGTYVVKIGNQSMKMIKQ